MLRIVTGFVILALAVGLGHLLSLRAARHSSSAAASARPVASRGVPTRPADVTRRRPPAPRELDGGGGRQPVVQDPLSEAACPLDMLLVDSVPCAGARPRCERSGPNGECLRFSRDVECNGKPPRLTFCVDRYEYPNGPGIRPAMLLTLEQAEAACRHESKRLCTAPEWTLACAGREHAPYPQGWVLGSGTCNVGPARRPPVEMLWNAKDLPAVVDRYDGREPSGASPGCTSAFGVSDLTGNVSEWVEVEPEGEARGGLAGGDFMGPAATCGAIKRIGSPHYAAFGVGARCCADPLVDLPRHR